MHLRRCVSAIALAVALAAPMSAGATGSRYHVVPGLGPQDFAPPSAARHPLGAPSANTGRAPAHNGRAHAPAQPAPVRAANLGGGFIEFLVTGGSGAGASRPIYNTPAPTRVPERPSVETNWQRPVHSRVAPAPEARPVSRRIDQRFSRQEVQYSGPHAPGTIVVDTPRRFLYLVQPGGRAIRYGIGVGRPGFEWAGVKRVTRKAEWPDWRPPAAMLKRRPDLPRFMSGGPDNPLGARALYLGSSLYRIHGTNEPWTIGRNVSSGCIRMMNHDVIDLYQRVRVGSRVVVI